MPELSQDDILSLSTTVGTMEDARRLASELVATRLAACVQLDAIAASFYRWEGRVCDEPEVRLTIKTLPALQERLQAFFARHHPYELPQFVVTRVGASKAYLEWVRGEVQG